MQAVFTPTTVAAVAAVTTQQLPTIFVAPNGHDSGHGCTKADPLDALGCARPRRNSQAS
jgi:hypothetical protein